MARKPLGFSLVQHRDDADEEEEEEEENDDDDVSAVKRASSKAPFGSALDASG